MDGHRRQCALRRLAIRASTRTSRRRISIHRPDGANHSIRCNRTLPILCRPLRMTALDQCAMISKASPQLRARRIVPRQVRCNYIVGIGGTSNIHSARSDHTVVVNNVFTCSPLERPHGEQIACVDLESRSIGGSAVARTPQRVCAPTRLSMRRKYKHPRWQTSACSRDSVRAMVERAPRPHKPLHPIFMATGAASLKRFAALLVRQAGFRPRE
jgi:hypothetical protein